MNHEEFLKRLDDSLEQLKDCLGKLETHLPIPEKGNHSKEEKKVLTRREVAKLFSCDPTTVDNWVKKGKLIKYGLGKRVYFLKNEVLEAMKKLL